MGKKLITMADVRDAAQAGQSKLLAPGDTCIVTPMAKDEADSLGITIDLGDCAGLPTESCSGPSFVAPSEKVIHEVCERLKSRMPAGSSSAKLETVVREVVYAKMGEGANRGATADKTGPLNTQGVRFIKHQELIANDKDSVPVDEKVLVAEAVGGNAEDELAGGYMVWEGASFSRKVERSEIAVIVEGELHLDVDGQTMVGKRGDMIYFPKGAVVAYNAPNRVKLACVNCI